MPRCKYKVSCGVIAADCRYNTRFCSRLMQATVMKWKIMVSENEFKRIRWACRRGMLELDLVMVPYVEHRFRDLDADNQQRFINLLESEDTDLFMWFLGRNLPEDPDLAMIVDDINAFTKTPRS
ncbi:FAD assembly factor SdhE [Zhongshania aliphaticivorans]|nr:FAD assembly factor SdhE [Zhongshania aliphaticivorans]